MTARPRPPQLTIHDLDWMAHGRCRETDPELWWPEKGHENHAARARTICGGCPVRVLCLDYAITHRIADGIWGGLTVGERRQLRRNRKTEAA